jgi:hypothetical protein
MRAIDTPGFGDSKGRDWKFAARTINFLKAQTVGVNLIALIVPESDRCSTAFRLMFKMLHGAFGSQGALWDHTAIVLWPPLHGRSKLETGITIRRCS